jgi:acetyltransferase-like isoleucine patch superfamily enzyme
MKVLLLQILRYVTNAIVAKVPSHTLRQAWYRHVLGIRMGERSTVLMDVYWYITGRQRPGKPTICIGSHTVINRECVLDGRGGLRIGDNVSISSGVWLLTSEHNVQSPTFDQTYAPVVIEDYAWLGSRATVLPGVSVGRGAVVAAGSVVTCDVEPYSVVAGVPARAVGVRSHDLRYRQDYRPVLE